MAHPGSEVVSTADAGLEPRKLGYWLSMGSPCCFLQGPRPPLAVPTYRQVTKAEIEAPPNNKAEAVTEVQDSSRKQNLVQIVNTAAEALRLWRLQNTEVEAATSPAYFLTSPPDLSLSVPCSLSWNTPCPHLHNDITLSHAVLCFSEVQLLSTCMLAIRTHEGTRPRPHPEEA